MTATKAYGLMKKENLIISVDIPGVKYSLSNGEDVPKLIVLDLIAQNKIKMDYNMATNIKTFTAK